MASLESVAMEGALMKRSDTLRQWRSRWFVLPRGSTSLLYRASADDFNLRGTISLIHASVGIMEAPANQRQWLCFFIQSPRGSYALAAESEAERAQWMTMIDMASAGASIQAAAWAAAAAAASCHVDFRSKGGPDPRLLPPLPGKLPSANGRETEDISSATSMSFSRDNPRDSIAENVAPGGGAQSAGAVPGPGTVDCSRQGSTGTDPELEGEGAGRGQGGGGRSGGISPEQPEKCAQEGEDGKGSGIPPWKGAVEGTVVKLEEDGAATSEAGEGEEGGQGWAAAGGEGQEVGINVGLSSANVIARDERRSRLARLADAQASLLAAWTTIKDHPRTRSFTSLVTSFGSTDASEAASCRSGKGEEGEAGQPVGAQVSSPMPAGSDASGDGDRGEFEDEQWSMAEDVDLEAPAGVGIQRAYFSLTHTAAKEADGEKSPLCSGQVGDGSALGEADSASPGLTWLEGGAAAILDQHAAWHTQEPSQVWATEPRRGLLAQAKQWVMWEGSEEVEPGILQEIQLKYENLAVTLERAAEALRAQESQMANLQVRVSQAERERDAARQQMTQLQAELARVETEWAQKLAVANQEAARQAEERQSFATEDAASSQPHLNQERAEKEELDKEQPTQEQLEVAEDAPVASAPAEDPLPEGLPGEKPAVHTECEELSLIFTEEGLAGDKHFQDTETVLLKPFWAA